MRGITEIERNEAERTEARISTIFQEGQRWFKPTEAEQICEANMRAFANGKDIILV